MRLGQGSQPTPRYERGHVYRGLPPSVEPRLALGFTQEVSELQYYWYYT